VSLSSVSSSFFPFSSSNHEHDDLDDLFTTDATTHTTPTTTPITTTTTTTTRNSVCDVFLGNNSHNNTNPSSASSSSSFVWQSLRHRILQASYFPEEAAQLPAFRTWVEDLWEFHTPRVDCAKLGPIPRTRPRWGNYYTLCSTDSTRSQQKPKKQQQQLRVGRERRTVVVVVVHSCRSHCTSSSWVVRSHRVSTVRIIPWVYRHWTHVNTRCAWPMRLEYLFNHKSSLEVLPSYTSPIWEPVWFLLGDWVSGDGLSIVSSSQLTHTTYHHLVVYAANDAQQQPDREGHFWDEEVPHFIQAAKNVRPCEEHLPHWSSWRDHVYGYDDVTVIHKNSPDIMRCSHRGTISWPSISRILDDTQCCTIFTMRPPWHT